MCSESRYWHVGAGPLDTVWVAATEDHEPEREVGVGRTVGCLGLFTLVAIAGVLLVVGAATLLVAPNAWRDDAPIPAGVDPSVERAIESGYVCPSWAHIREYTVEPTNDVRFTCTWSVFGFPRFTGSATCGDGRWNVSGIRDLQLTNVVCTD
jgi:hypothetical protein